MSGFGEYFKNEKRKNTIGFFRDFFKTFFNKESWYFILFWLFLASSVYGLYKILTFENKFNVDCGKIIKVEKESNLINSEIIIHYHFFVENNKNQINDIEVGELVYNKYEKILESEKDTTFCYSFINKIFIFYIVLTVLIFIIAIVFLLNSF
jgi:hypothetical protein